LPDSHALLFSSVLLYEDKVREEHSLFEKLYEAGEEGFNRFLSELLSNPTVADVAKKALKNAAATKGKIDRGVDSFLFLFNLPSKDDYNKLLAKLETVQGSLVNVNMKLDRLLAEQHKQKKPARRKKAPAPIPSKL
jgi:galactokinase/mevalonate kinase-like predicted kinase